jgi:hypothetical protein
MLAGPKQAVSGPNEPPRSVRPGHRGQLARLIRERPVFVNLAARRIRVLRNAHNVREYINIRGVFPWEDGRLAFRPVAADLDNGIAEPG